VTVIEINNVSKSYGDTKALNDLSLDVGTGEVFGFLGPNGAGKTTTIKVLTGHITPDSGSVSVLGIDPTKNGIDVREKTGILPEKQSPFNYLTPRGHLQLVGDIRDMDDDVVEERINEWAERLAFEDKLDTLNNDLSRGQQQKVMITQAFIHEPELVFIDEPLANLDPIMQEQMKEYITGYVDGGRTIFLSTHHIEVAEQICDRVGIIDSGSLVATRNTDELDEGQLIETFIDDVSESNSR